MALSSDKLKEGALNGWHNDIEWERRNRLRIDEKLVRKVFECLSEFKIK